jgi:hypothetical protein
MAPQVTGHNALNLNQFTLMNSVLEFLVMPANATTSSGNSIQQQQRLHRNRLMLWATLRYLKLK